MPKAFSPQENDLITRRLLDQGYRLFSAYGLRKTNVEEIAQAAGISKGAFYNFYASKEALFMDVIAQAEGRIRQHLLAAIDQPGPTPRARLVHIFKDAFALFESIPILSFFTGTDFDLLFRRIPPEKLQEHLVADQAFIEHLFMRCREAGIPIRAETDDIIGLLYQVVMVVMHQDEMSKNTFGGSLDLLLELVAAYCLGEIEGATQIRPGDGLNTPLPDHERI